MQVFTHQSDLSELSTLPKGRYIANVGFNVEQSATPDRVMEAVTALKESGKEFAVASQAALIVKAQDLGVAFQDWGKLSVW